MTTAPSYAEQTLQEKIKRLRESQQQSHSTAEVVDLIQSVITALRERQDQSNDVILQSLSEVAANISAARQDIAGLNPSLLTEEMPQAHDELDAVVKATEDATNNILEATEEIQAISKELPPAQKEKIQAQTMHIFEASNFQDITGQRITKVVAVLKTIEENVQNLLKALGYHEEAGQLVRDDNSKKASPDDPASLLHGPQLPENANDQDAIDAILASLD